MIRLVLPFLLLLGCPGKSNPSDLDATVDASVVGDAGEDGAAPVETLPLEVGGWMAGMVDENNDTVYDSLDQGTFELPVEGDYLGTTWSEVAQGDNHSFGIGGIGLFYVAAEVTPPPGHRVFARADSIYTIFTNLSARQPGDFYHTRRTRVPLGTVEGSNLVVARCYSRNAASELELWSTNAEVVYNTLDVTAPSLVVGRADDAYLGVATLHLGDRSALDVSARVVEDATFEPTEVLYDALAPDAVTQLSFLLRPKAAFDEADQTFGVTLRLESPSWVRTYETEVDLSTLAEGSRYRQTRLSGVDGSTQYHAVMPPSDPQAGQTYGLILSLHGASVEASGQAGSYSPKDWAYLVAATNRRPFGFDWEEWGRLDALEAMEHAMSNLPIDPERVHLTGHSMGGHGTWHVGVHHTGRFGVIAPSAGWISFELYGGPAHPAGVFGRARAHSQTLDFVDNLADSSIFIIHGSADDNVPVSHAQQMFQTLEPIVTDLQYHEEPGVGHWWDLDPAEEGTDCVDWEPMIEVMRNRNRVITPLAFHFSSSSPWVSSEHSFVRVLSEQSPMENFAVDATTLVATEVSVTTTNVRSLVLDGAALASQGVDTVHVDGTPHAVTGVDIEIGPTGGKTARLHGPLNQLFHRPFCFVYDADGPEAFRRYAAFLLSWWSIIGNGHGCAVALADLTPELAADRNLVYLGVPMDQIDGSGALPITWDPDGVTIAGAQHPASAMAYVYPDGDRLTGYFSAAAGAEYLLFRYVPFSSRAGMPDFLIWQEGGSSAAGFFDADWQIEPLFATGL